MDLPPHSFLTSFFQSLLSRGGAPVLLVLLGLCLGSLGPWGCEQPQPHGPSPYSRLTHNAGEPLSPRGSWQWIRVSEDEFYRVNNAGGWRKTQAALPDTDARAQRLQKILDVFDERLRLSGDPAFDFVPPPVARVYTSESVNGFVSAASVCYDFSMPSEGSENSENAPSDDITPYLGIRDEKNDFDVAPRGCLTGENVFELDAFLEWVTGRMEGCEATRDAQGILFKGTCPASWKRNANADGRVQRIAHLATLSRVSLTTAAFEKLTPSAFEALVAHELGHYYRSHATAAWNEYNYFHRVPEKGEPRKPRPDPSLEPLGRQLVSLGSLLPFPEPREGENHPALVGMMAGVSSFLSSLPTENTPACSAFQEAYTQNGAALWPYVTGAKRDEEGADMWAEVDRRFGACLMTLILTPEEMASLLPFNMKDIDTRPLSSLADALPEIDRRHRQQVELFYSAKRERLGYFTVEQEADDFSVELLSLAQLDPKSIAELLVFQFASTVALSEREATSLTEVGYSACLASREKGWRDATGAPQFIPIANFHGAHHSLCYRLFNVDRELEAHAFKLPQE